MTDAGCPIGPGGYPSDCDVTQGLLARSRERDQVAARGPAWQNALAKATGIKLLLLDVDGVLTDSTIVYTHSGTEMKGFSTKDGFGIRILQESGVAVGVITARSSEAVQRRAEDLKLAHVYQGIRNKMEVFEEILAKEQLTPAQVAYMGDDWLDLPLLIRVGFAAAPADAVAEVREAAHYVATVPGGRGAVREVCMLLIAAQGKERALLEKYRR
ncbi:MAG: 3-deoxy-D-manno-octulosonate 8-phosphate phosphatase [Thermodesulfobacteriota bacterium]